MKGLLHIIALLICLNLVEGAKKKKEPKVDVDVRQPRHITDPSEIFQHNQEVLKQNQCNPDLPNLSVGDGNLTDKNIAKYKKDYSLFVVGMSDSGCELCCTTETYLNSLKQEISVG
jgi:hypothetical protein